MNRRRLFLTLLACWSVTLLVGTAAEKKSSSPRFPLRGVITRVEVDGPALMVKHEEIPGVMRAMTMRFSVAPEVVRQFKAGDVITALMSRVGDEWRLDQVKPATSGKPSGTGAIATPAKSVLTIAAAANLVSALEPLNAEFKRAHPAVTVNVTVGASGSLFAQLKNGAPFDLFLSADLEYPEQAVAAGLTGPQSLRVFATGRLVLWTKHQDLDVGDLAAALRSPALRKLALAQPKTAPYGRAAQATMEKLGAWERLGPKLVYGESITQTAQFVETGAADAGFIALSLVRGGRLAQTGRWQEVPPSLHAGVSLDHAAVVTKQGAKNSAAVAYLDFLSSPPAQAVLRNFGYEIPSAAQSKR